jgi:hypothetical protein
MPGSAGSVETSSLRKTLMPTVPLVWAHSAIASATAGSVGSTGFDQPEPLGVRSINLKGIAGGVAVQAER